MKFDIRLSEGCQQDYPDLEPGTFVEFSYPTQVLSDVILEGFAKH
jgi:hypothetical protein